MVNAAAAVLLRRRVPDSRRVFRPRTTGAGPGFQQERQENWNVASKPMRKIDAALADAMAAEAQAPPSEDRLTRVREKISELRDLEFENQSLQERMRENSEKIREIKEKTLVDMFDSAGISSLGIEAEGNLPPYDVEIGPYYHANIPDETADQAFAWLTKNKHGDLIRGTYTVTFGRGEEKNRRKFEEYLEKNQFDFSYKFGVPWNTLTAFVREQIEVYKREPPLKLLGATVGRVAKLKKQKKGK